MTEKCLSEDINAHSCSREFFNLCFYRILSREEGDCSLFMVTLFSVDLKCSSGMIILGHVSEYYAWYNNDIS